MKLLECKLLADENIHPVVVDFLSQSRCDVKTVGELELVRQADEIILEEARMSERLVLTYDRDFGKLTVLMQRDSMGIIFLRPGHIDPLFTIATHQVIDTRDFDFSPSFILVARRRGMHVQIRLRRW